MSLNQTLQSLKLATLFGGVLGLGVGCLVTVSPLEPCDSGSNNKLNDAGECECRIGFEWCNPDDINDLNCCEDETASSATSGPGDGDPGDGDPGDGDPGDGDPGDGDPGDGDGDPGDGDGDPGDGDGDCGPGELPPDTCSEQEEGFFWCTNLEEETPCGSMLFVCQGGQWVEDTETAQASCEFDGFDFTYGCIDDGQDVIFECGDGPGTPCEDSDPTFCVDDDVLGYCLWNKLTHDSCQLFCEEVGIDGQTYEYGECDESVPDDIACFCCDSGTQGCPI